jgi:hypothetical protein
MHYESDPPAPARVNGDPLKASNNAAERFRQGVQVLPVPEFRNRHYRSRPGVGHEYLTAIILRVKRKESNAPPDIPGEDPTDRGLRPRAAASMK